MALGINWAQMSATAPDDIDRQNLGLIRDTLTLNGLMALILAGGNFANTFAPATPYWKRSEIDQYNEQAQLLPQSSEDLLVAGGVACMVGGSSQLPNVDNVPYRYSIDGMLVETGQPEAVAPLQIGSIV